MGDVDASRRAIEKYAAEHTIGPDHDGWRLDKAVQHLAGISRAQARKLIATGQVRLDGVNPKEVRINLRVADLEGHRDLLDLKSRYGMLADRRYSRKAPPRPEEIAAIADEIATPTECRN